MISQLRKDIQSVLEDDDFDYISAEAHVYMYDTIRSNVLRMYPGSPLARRLPQITDYSDFIDDADAKRAAIPMLIELFTATGQVMAFLAAVIGDPDKKIETLNSEITLLKDKNSKLEEVNILTSESLNKYIKAEEFPISEEIWSKIPKDLSPTLHDAFRAYGTGSYTACVCVCRNVIQGLVQEQCAKEGIKENGLNKQIEALISRKKIKQKHNQTLLDTVATLGHRSAHPTTEVFTKEKASLVLNGLLILIDEVFT